MVSVQYAPILSAAVATPKKCGPLLLLKERQKQKARHLCLGPVFNGSRWINLVWRKLAFDQAQSVDLIGE